MLCEGEKNLLDADIPAVAGMQPDGSFASKDLYTAISNGDFPEWYMYIQASAPVLPAYAALSLYKCTINTHCSAHTVWPALKSGMSVCLTLLHSSCTFFSLPLLPCCVPH